MDSGALSHPVLVLATSTNSFTELQYLHIQNHFYFQKKTKPQKRIKNYFWQSTGTAEFLVTGKNGLKMPVFASESF